MSAEDLDNHDLNSDLDSLWDSVSDVIDEAPEGSGAVDNTQIQEFNKQFESVKEKYDELDKKENSKPDSSKWYVDIDFSAAPSAYTQSDYFSLNCVSSSYTEDNYIALNFMSRAPMINIETFKYHHVSSTAYDYRINYQLPDSENHFFYGFFYEGHAFYAQLPNSKSVTFLDKTFKSATSSTSDITLNSSNLSFYLADGFNFWSSSDNTLILKGIDILLDNSDSEGFSPSYEYPDVDIKMGQLDDVDTTVKSEIEDENYNDDIDFDNLPYPFPTASYVGQKRNYPEFEDLNSVDKNEYYYCSDIFMDFEDYQHNSSGNSICPNSYFSNNKNFSFFGTALCYNGYPNTTFSIKLPLSLKGKGIRFAVKSIDLDYKGLQVDFDIKLRSSDGSIISDSQSFSTTSDCSFSWVTLLYSDLGISSSMFDKYDQFYIEITSDSFVTHKKSTLCFDEFHFFDVAPMDKVLVVISSSQQYEAAYGNVDRISSSWSRPSDLKNFGGYRFQFTFKDQKGNVCFAETSNKNDKGSSDQLKIDKNSLITKLTFMSYQYFLASPVTLKDGCSLTFGVDLSSIALDCEKWDPSMFLSDYFAKYIDEIYLYDSSSNYKCYKYSLSGSSVLVRSNGYQAQQVSNLIVNIPNITGLKDLSSIYVTFKHNKSISQSLKCHGAYTKVNTLCFSLENNSYSNIGDYFKSLFNWLGDVFSTLINIPKNIYDYFSNPNSTFFQKIVGMPKAIFEWFKGSFSQFLSFPLDIAKQSFNAFKDVLGQIVNFNKKLLSASIDFFKSLPGRIVELFKAIIEIPKKIAEWIKSLFIPTQSQLNKVVYTEKKFLEENGGFVFQTPVLMSRLFHAVTTTSQRAKLTFPKISLPMGNNTYTLSSAHSVNFSNYFNGKLLTAVRVIFSVTLVLSLLSWLIRKGLTFFRERTDES